MTRTPTHPSSELLLTSTPNASETPEDARLLACVRRAGGGGGACVASELRHATMHASCRPQVKQSAQVQVIFGTSLKLLAQKLETCELGSYKMPTHTMRTRVNKRLDGGLCRLTAVVQRTFAPCDLRQLRRCPSVCMGKVETMHCGKFSCLRQNKSQSSDSIVTFFFPVFFERVRKNARTKHLGARAHHVCVLSEGRRVHAFLYASRVLAQSGPIFRV
jgi:hypothetical protein